MNASAWPDLSNLPGEMHMTHPGFGSAIEFGSPFTFEKTVERPYEAISNAGMKLFATIDQAANARDAGLSMPSTVVLIYGKAEGRTPITLISPRSALDLPLHVLVREDADHRTIVGFRPIVPTPETSDVPAALAGRLEPAQKLLVKAIES
ncbi:DUF302 domain-containing protein [Rhodanobacter hydrolyticus]|uniref:DUF302 domain-containing protein n=1 Tax=Rhodanobacter hydrolyticus TaxID=2250595 RepID=A0ABW8J1N6_9GAMM